MTGAHLFSKVAALQVLMSQVLTLINSTLLNAGQAINDMVSFEANLSSVCGLVYFIQQHMAEQKFPVDQIFVPDDSLTPNLMYNVMTVEQLQVMWPYVNACFLLW